MKSSLLIPMMLLSATGAWHLSTNNPHAPTSAITVKTVQSVQEKTPSEKKQPGMWASTSAVYLGETFTLNFKTPHAQYLGVTDPAGHFFYVIFPKAYASEGLQPLISGEDFIGRKQIVFDPQTLRADPYTYGVTENQKVFTRNGNYTFVLGENLHVDDPALVQKITIQYHSSKRPVNAVASTR
jgi:hypothetical protein